MQSGIKMALGCLIVTTCTNPCTYCAFLLPVFATCCCRHQHTGIDRFGVPLNNAILYWSDLFHTLLNVGQQAAWQHAWLWVWGSLCMVRFKAVLDGG
jgi:hypothetical protein